MCLGYLRAGDTLVVWRLDRPAKLSPEQTRLARARYKAQDVTVAEIARALGVGRGTIYRALQQTP